MSKRKRKTGKRSTPVDPRLKMFGEYLIKLREGRGLTQHQVAEEIGISTMFISELERGKKKPSHHTVRLLANFYQVYEDKLFDMLGFVPLKALEALNESDTLQTVLSKIQGSKNLTDQQKEKLYKRLLDLYEEMEEDDE